MADAHAPYWSMLGTRVPDAEMAVDADVDICEVLELQPHRRPREAFAREALRKALAIPMFDPQLEEARSRAAAAKGDDRAKEAVAREAWRLLTVPPAQMEAICRQLLLPRLQQLQQLQWANRGNPFDLKITKGSVKRWGMPDYLERVPRPMDLRRMQERIRKGSYLSSTEMDEEVRLIVDNAKAYHGADSELGRLADELWAVWDERARGGLHEEWQEAVDKAKRRVMDDILRAKRQQRLAQLANA